MLFYISIEKHKKCGIINMLNKLNINAKWVYFSRDKYTLFSSYSYYEFDKNADSFYVSVIKSILRKVC